MTPTPHVLCCLTSAKVLVHEVIQDVYFQRWGKNYRRKLPSWAIFEASSRTTGNCSLELSRSPLVKSIKLYWSLVVQDPEGPGNQIQSQSRSQYVQHNIYIYIHTSIHICIYTCIHTYMHIVYTPVVICIYVAHMYIYICIYIYVYLRIRAHTCNCLWGSVPS